MEQSKKKSSNRDNKNELIKTVDMQQSLHDYIAKSVAVYLSY